MNSRQARRSLGWRIFFVCLTVSSCSNEHNLDIAKNINLEFELTYQYVVENMSIEGRNTRDFSILKQNNKDAFTSIAYTWHSISMNECGLADSSNRKSNASSYDRLTQNAPTNNYLTKTIINKERACLAKIYFANWSDIQRMLSLSFPTFE